MSKASSTTTLRLVGEVGGRRRTYVLEPGSATIGALAECDICLQDPSVSRRHARLRVRRGLADVEDLGSTNCTRVNGVACKTGSLGPGDWLEIGAIALYLEQVSTEETEIAISLDQPSSISARRDRDASTELLVPGRAHHPWLDLLQRLANNRRLPVFDQELASGLQRISGATAVAVVSAGSVRALSGAADRLDNERQRLAIQDGDVEVLIADAHSAPEAEAVAQLALLLRREATSPAEPNGSHDPVNLVLPDHHVEGRSETAMQMYDQIRAAVRSSAPVLIVGETGAGKEHVVRILHASSDRSTGPLRCLNCAAIPADLLEAELFGIDAGVATGVSARPGAMRLTDGGTLFFDEIGDMAPTLQAKLLRALEEGQIQPVGAQQPVAVDVRFVAATNTDLDAAVRSGAFRSDLYYRLAGHIIEVPPLRERREDIPALVEHFLRTASAATGITPAGLSLAALRALQEAPWPGNIRQLEHEIRRVVATVEPGTIVERRHLGPSLQKSSCAANNDDSVVGDLNLKRQVETLEKRLVIRAVDLAEGNLADAARRLGLSRNGLVMKMHRLGIQRD